MVVEKKKKRITVAAAKSKGRRLQQKIAKSISELLNIPWGKDELIASREMGQTGTDIRLIGEAQIKFPYSVEAKNCENWQIFSWIKQAKANQLKNTDWLLICSRNNFPPVVIMEWSMFHDLKKKYDFFETSGAGLYEYKSWKLPLWIQEARKRKDWTRPWFINCYKNADYHVAVMDFEQFFEVLRCIPSEVKR